MITTEAFSEVVSQIYAAAVNPQLWDGAVARVHRAFTTRSAAAGQVRCTSLAFADGVSRSMTGTMSLEADRDYREHYGRQDYVLQAVERGPVGVLRTGSELIAPHTHNEFYADWVRPNELVDGLFVRLTNNATPASLVIAGTQGTRPFDTDERNALLAMLVPHFQQALRTHSHLLGLAGRNGELAEALNGVDHGVLIVASDLRVVHANTAAEQLLRDSDGLGSRDGRLVASAPGVRSRLDAALYRALTDDASGLRHGACLACERPSGRRPYAVHVVPMNARECGLGSSTTTAMVLVVDPERRPVPAPDLLRAMFGLTRTESVVVQLALSGEGLGAIAERLRLSRDTVKTHLTHVFLKTSTHRQAELVRLVLAIGS